MDKNRNYVIFDNSIVSCLSEAGADPVSDFEHTEFAIAYTPDLKHEYVSALEHPAPSDRTRELTRKIFRTGTLLGFFGFSDTVRKPAPYLGFDQGVWADVDQIEVINSICTRERKEGSIPKNRTDSGLIAFAKDAIVLTNDRGAHWKHSPKGKGRVIHWEEFQEILSEERNFACALRRALSSVRG